MKKPCLNVIYEDDNLTIPEVDDFDLLLFGKTFMMIQARNIESLQKANKKLKVANF